MTQQRQEQQDEDLLARVAEYVAAMARSLRGHDHGSRSQVASKHTSDSAWPCPTHEKS